MGCDALAQYAFSGVDKGALEKARQIALRWRDRAAHAAAVDRRDRIRARKHLRLSTLSNSASGVSRASPLDEAERRSGGTEEEGRGLLEDLLLDDEDEAAWYAVAKDDVPV